MPEEPKPPRKSPLVQFARYSQLALVLPACTVLGWLLGSWLDRRFHTTWMEIAGLLLGIAAGFYELVRTATSDEEKR
ncbi:MAG TPA: AtpZ/AtpI family protein [Terriglobales bacterium]|nr:AtpZ/AtpI family protein [Terriglobales bacterium]